MKGNCRQFFFSNTGSGVITFVDQNFGFIPRPQYPKRPAGAVAGPNVCLLKVGVVLTAVFENNGLKLNLT